MLCAAAFQIAYRNPLGWGRDGDQGLFEFRKDTAYLYTAALLCETGLLLVEKYGSLSGGCWTPAAALGGDLTERILKELDASLEIKELAVEE